MAEIPSVRPFGPAKADSPSVDKARAVTGNSAKISSFIQSARFFEPKESPKAVNFRVSVGLPDNQFLGLASMLNIEHSTQNLRFLKDYTGKEFIDKINAFKHLPLVHQAIEQIALSFKEWNTSEDQLNLEDTLSNQFNNLEVLIDVIADILPQVGDRVTHLQCDSDILRGKSRIEGEDSFRLRDHFLKQLS